MARIAMRMYQTNRIHRQKVYKKKSRPMNSKGLDLHIPLTGSTLSDIQTTLCEFLESSTIHGLVYINRSRSKWGKISWTVITLLGFSTAGYLIHDSFNDWAESPTVTSVETFPISEVPFPEVTVCPPFGSNTALNYDLCLLYTSPSPRD